MKIILIFFGFVLFSTHISGQIASNLPSTASIANTSVSDSKNWATFNNPVMIAYIDKALVGLQYENRFQVSELSMKSFQFGFETDIVNLGFSFSHFGYSLYNEMNIGLGFARNFGNKFAMGMQLNYYTSFFASSNQYRGVLLPQLGLHVNFSSSFSVGLNIYNPFQSNLQTEYTIKRLPSIFSIGSQYFFSPELVWRTQVDKEISSNYRVATGFEYSMLQLLTIKLGAYGTDYLVPCIGFGTKIGAFRFDLNGELHPLLGLTTLAALRYSFSQ